jgi:hypothetical protein
MKQPKQSLRRAMKRIAEGKQNGKPKKGIKPGTAGGHNTKRT